MALHNQTDGVDTAGAGVMLVVYAVFAGIAIVIFALYKLQPETINDFASKWGVAAAIGFLTAGYGGYSVVAAWRRCRLTGRRSFVFACSAAIVSLAVLVGVIEGTLRLLAVETSEGVAVGNIRLLPTWREVADRNRRLLDIATPSGTWAEPYLVFDRELGWVVGKGRVNESGLYASSVEGIRSGTPGIRFADSRSRYQIAVVGDSNAFALEVPFEDSWSYQLEQLLGDEVQVLNFGVNGYGLDQAVLRYERDVRKISPDLVILMFIQHDLTRSTVVYPFVSFSSWVMPFAKPRFVLDGDRLFQVNAPLEDPSLLFDGRDLASLPSIELDYGYRSELWQTRTDGLPLLLRLVVTLSPYYPPADKRISAAETIMLNAALLERFYWQASEESSVLVVYVPTSGAGDFEVLPRENLARTAAARAAVPILDLTDCISAVPEARRRTPTGKHYSPTANRAIAACLLEDVSIRLKTGRQNTIDSLRP